MRIRNLFFVLYSFILVLSISCATDPQPLSFDQLVSQSDFAQLCASAKIIWAHLEELYVAEDCSVDSLVISLCRIRRQTDELSLHFYQLFSTASETVTEEEWFFLKEILQQLSRQYEAVIVRYKDKHSRII